MLLRQRGKETLKFVQSAQWLPIEMKVLQKHGSRQAGQVKAGHCHLADHYS